MAVLRVPLHDPLGFMSQLPHGALWAAVSSSLNIKRMILDSAVGRDSRTVAVILKLSYMLGSHFIILIWGGEYQ